MHYFEPEIGRFVKQDPIGLVGGDNLYQLRRMFRFGLIHGVWFALYVTNPEILFRLKMVHVEQP